MSLVTSRDVRNQLRERWTPARVHQGWRADAPHPRWATRFRPGNLSVTSARTSIPSMRACPATLHQPRSTRAYHPSDDPSSGRTSTWTHLPGDRISLGSDRSPRTDPGAAATRDNHPVGLVVAPRLASAETHTASLQLTTRGKYAIQTTLTRQSRTLLAGVPIRSRLIRGARRLPCRRRCRYPVHPPAPRRLAGDGEHDRKINPPCAVLAG